jgi:hypothetical protein
MRRVSGLDLQGARCVTDHVERGAGIRRKASIARPQKARVMPIRISAAISGPDEVALRQRLLASSVAE